MKRLDFSKLNIALDLSIYNGWGHVNLLGCFSSEPNMLCRIPFFVPKLERYCNYRASKISSLSIAMLKFLSFKIYLSLRINNFPKKMNIPNLSKQCLFENIVGLERRIWLFMNRRSECKKNVHRVFETNYKFNVSYQAPGEISDKYLYFSTLHIFVYRYYIKHCH